VNLFAWIQLPKVFHPRQLKVSFEMIEDRSIPLELRIEMFRFRAQLEIEKTKLKYAMETEITKFKCALETKEQIKLRRNERIEKMKFPKMIVAITSALMIIVANSILQTCSFQEIRNISNTISKVVRGMNTGSVLTLAFSFIKLSAFIYQHL
jgi:hypothetical protein